MARVRDPHRPSLVTRYLTTECNGQELGSATGFLVSHQSRLHLITNAHVLRGVGADGTPAHPSGAVPDCVRIRHLVATDDDGLEHQERIEAVTEEFEPLWYEHPTLGRRVDVAALPLAHADVWAGVFDPAKPLVTEVGIGDDVSVIGYPFGVGAESLPLWTRATVASEFYFDFDGLPCFLVDARTRPGQSGSPVVWFRPGGYFDRSGAIAMAGLTSDPPTPGTPVDPERERSGTATEQLLGVYSGRVHEDADLGYVWRASAILEVVEGAQIATR